MIRFNSIPWWGMIMQVGDMIRIDPYTELIDDQGMSYVCGEELVAMITSWHDCSYHYEMQLLCSGQILYLKDNWDKIGWAFRRLENDNSDRQCYAASIREGLDNSEGRQCKSEASTF